MTDAPKLTRRSFRPTPAWLIFGLLVVEGLLWLSERYTWFWFNEKKGWTVLIGVAIVGGAMLVMLLWLIGSLIWRWRFQFSIRSLLVLTLAVSIPCSWLAVESKAIGEQREAVEEIRHAGGSVIYNYQVIEAGGNFFYFADQTPLEPGWLRRLTGDDFFGKPALVFYEGNKIGDAGLTRLNRLSQLIQLCFSNSEITDTTMRQVKGMSQLQDLSLDGTKVTDAGLANLTGLTHLKRLDLDSTRITDVGLRYARELTGLQTLRLLDTSITDGGLDDLKGLTTLHRLVLGSTQISDAGVKRLQQALPHCQIER